MYLYEFLVFGVILLKYLDKFFVCLFMVYQIIRVIIVYMYFVYNFKFIEFFIIDKQVLEIYFLDRFFIDSCWFCQEFKLSLKKKVYGMLFVWL